MSLLGQSRASSRKQQTDLVKTPIGRFSPSANVPKNKTSGRRSKQAKHRAFQMRQLYEDSRSTPSGDPGTLPTFGHENTYSEEELEEQADQLYEWTQDLSIESIDCS
jgi:hypothetical protein